ncbi:MAG TPA: hypothetical protein VEG38_22705 [Acidimicrobiia bacterium]|nr:hypothetical protein [Acidimicrobiia bacterium]
MHRVTRRSVGAKGAALLAIALLVVFGPGASAEPGALDVGFGAEGGGLRTNLGGTYDWAYATAIQPDGRILAAGVSNARGTHDFAVARYTTNRDLDPSFGEGGVALIDFNKSFDWAYAMALQPDGKIVVAGVSDGSGSKDFALARLGPNGTLDRNFGKGGRTTGQMRSLSADTIRDMAVQPDGRIVVAGVTYDDVVTAGPHGDFMVARYLPDGRPDLGFGLGGFMTTDFAGESYDDPYAVVLQRDGKIVLGGYTNTGSGPGVLFGADQLALARYSPQGLLDSTFGAGGKVVFDGGSLDERILALAPAADGGLFAGGYVNGEKRSDLLLARLTPDGELTSGFGNMGTGFSVHNLGTYSERLASLAVQPDGRIVAGGQTAVAHHADFAVFRYRPDGLFDESFGQGGVATFDFQGREDRVHDVALQSDGKILAVGQSEADFALARFNAN